MISQSTFSDDIRPRPLTAWLNMPSLEIVNLVLRFFVFVFCDCFLFKINQIKHPNVLILTYMYVKHRLLLNNILHQHLHVYRLYYIHWFWYSIFKGKIEYIISAPYTIWVLKQFVYVDSYDKNRKKKTDKRTNLFKTSFDCFKVPCLDFCT